LHAEIYHKGVSTKQTTFAPELTPDQRKILHVMLHGENVFLSGRAGTGKSYLLSRYLVLAKRRHRNVLVTAPTGVAAINLKDGHTMHKEFQIPVGVFLDPDSDPAVGITPSMRAADTIVIDEISMCRRDVFDYVMARIEYLNNTSKKHVPKQLIVVGDFFQLPPVVKNDELALLRSKYPDFGDKGFCFRSPYWKSMHFLTCTLTDVIRQKDDAKFIQMLSKIRNGDTSCLAEFNRKVTKPEEYDDTALELVSTNRKAIEINQERLAKIDEKPIVYRAEIVGNIPSGEYPAEDRLMLKKGARIISLVNDVVNMQFANGSVGTVLEVSPDSVLVQFDSGTVARIKWHVWEKTKTTVVGDAIVPVSSGSFKQIPLRLAWAVTIHRSQGKTFDKIVVDPQSFESGQLYVALSRCRSLSGIQLMCPIRNRDLINTGEVLDFYNSFAMAPKDLPDYPEEENEQSSVDSAIDAWEALKTAPAKASDARPARPEKKYPERHTTGDDSPEMIMVPKKYVARVYEYLRILDELEKKKK
jgi:ATP-dependent DNA helicase PIF1